MREPPSGQSPNVKVTIDMLIGTEGSQAPRDSEMLQRRCFVQGATQGRSKSRRAITHPKMRSGCAMKSVMRSSMLRGSRTKVGKVTLERSMPTLVARTASASDAVVAAARGTWGRAQIVHGRKGRASKSGKQRVSVERNEPTEILAPDDDQRRSGAGKRHRRTSAAKLAMR